MPDHPRRCTGDIDGDRRGDVPCAYFSSAMTVSQREAIHQMDNAHMLGGRYAVAGGDDFAVEACTMRSRDS